MSYLDLPNNQNPLWAKLLALADAKNGVGLSVDEIANFVIEAAKVADNLHKVTGSVDLAVDAVGSTSGRAKPV